MTYPIFPCLWFDGKAKEAAAFYCSVFKNSKVLSENPMVVVFELNDTKFMALNGGPEYAFSPANSYVITCDTQEEIDYYWVKLSEGGKPGKCGWLTDKFGVSWQTVVRCYTDNGLSEAEALRNAIMVKILDNDHYQDGKVIIWSPPHDELVES